MDLPANSPLRVGNPLPPSMGRCADLYHDVRELRLAMEKEAEAIKARETEIQEHIIATLSVGDDTGAAGLKYRAQVVIKPQPRLVTGEAGDGWGLFTSWVRKNDFFHMIQKRLNETAVKEWVDEQAAAGQPRMPPGVERIQVKTLSVNKI